ncbi:1,6-anhydro-N-acetylmuramyl-L-alanine amidase AmpD [Dechloromonas sp. TW-R-39-2]|uniref:1,6-anhydro-N-acetylmuramyl-L-alanine amidase AmpD n=1 Tax=Dechloromonas sp. TW-R-39-2 TaxID=2654218 RepID=UPI00193D1EA3|nr:1,6-anhydro-N-acetylmuramyl-L-alanine amidase AmpD [Dechloromonas sp. TW-R-39-2]QRM18855.1 1,6-anhydro-N-acetylmuramyl-L-alanine amidase AmpD [Dechloromonas sp. TW-R-39-2]
MSDWAPGGWLSGVRHVYSPNFGERPDSGDVSLIVVHNISLPPDHFGGPWVEQFFTNQLDPQAHPYFAQIAPLQVSAHFFVRRDGTVIQFVGCDQRAWHAGRSTWSGRENCNDFSVGIELEGSDFQAYPAEQYAALGALIEALRQRYPITEIAGHCHVAPERKTDPGPFFDWAELARRYPDLILPAEISF